MNFTHAQRPQIGTVLVVGLVMLAVITLLATATARTAISALLMARSHQAHDSLFQAAEAGIEFILSEAIFDTGTPRISTRSIDRHTSVEMQVVFVGQTDVPEETFRTVTESGLSAYHFVGTASATLQSDPSVSTPLDISTSHSQSFYVVGPSSTVSAPTTISLPQGAEWQVCTGADCRTVSFKPSPVRTAWRTGHWE